MTELDRADYDFLLNNARVGRQIGLPHFIHLDQPIGLLNYIRIANDIIKQMSPGRLLDWGAGYGQMTYLLSRRGFRVIPFDIGSPADRLPDVPLVRCLPPLIRVKHPTWLPFKTAGFDAVLSCGVLEHVDEYSQPGNEMKSLREIARVLRTGGTFFIYQLPQRYAWQEAIIRRSRLGYSHPRRFTVPEITQMLHNTGFSVRRIRRANLIPKNLTGMPSTVRYLYSHLGQPLIFLDRFLAQLPLLREVAGVLEITAKRLG